MYITHILLLKGHLFKRTHLQGHKFKENVRIYISPTEKRTLQYSCRSSAPNFCLHTGKVPLNLDFSWVT